MSTKNIVNWGSGPTVQDLIDVLSKIPNKQLTMKISFPEALDYADSDILGMEKRGNEIFLKRSVSYTPQVVIHDDGTLEVYSQEKLSKSSRKRSTM